MVCVANELMNVNNMYIHDHFLVSWNIKVFIKFLLSIHFYLICTSDLGNVFSNMLTILWFSVPGPLGCTIAFHEPVLRLCKNTIKRFGSLDIGYHTNFSYIYKTSLTPQLGAEQDDDEVDWCVCLISFNDYCLWFRFWKCIKYLRIH